VSPSRGGLLKNWVLPLQREWLVRHSLAVRTQTRPCCLGVGVREPWLEALSLKAMIGCGGNKAASLLDTAESPSFVHCSSYFNPGLWGIQAMPCYL